jgi:hypothetical protein
VNLTRMLTLHRGISVPTAQAEAVRAAILRDGLQGGEGFGRIELNDLRPRLESFLGQPDLTTEATRPSVWVKTAEGGHRRLIDGFPTVCAADPLGAAYYARVHDTLQRAPDGRARYRNSGDSHHLDGAFPVLDGQWNMTQESLGHSPSDPSLTV